MLQIHFTHERQILCHPSRTLLRWAILKKHSAQACEDRVGDTPVEHPQGALRTVNMN